MVLTHVDVLFSLLLVPDRDVEALLGEVGGGGVVVDKLLPELRVQGPPLGRRSVPALNFATGLQQPENTKRFKW